MIDSHSHIYTKPYRNDLNEVLEHARAAGITQLLQVGCNLEDSEKALQLAIKTPGVYASVGIHPHDADSWTPETGSLLQTMCRHNKVVAFGEIGLDFYYDNSPRGVQITAFQEQMKLIQNLEAPLPVVIHTRDAETETLEILSAYPLPRGGHVHCYTGTIDTAKAILDLGYHIGFTGVITFNNAEELREVVKIMPMEKILIETDSPYLSPVPHRGKRNEPAFVKHVAEKIADIKGTTVNQVIQATSENFYKLYGKPGFVWEVL